MKIAFLGSHGSGKTTTIEYVKNNLENQGKNVEIIVMGWKNFHNPLLKLFSNLYLKSDYKKNKNEERLDRFKERSWAFYFVYYIELLSRYLKIKRSKKDFVLMDRYFYEELMFMSKTKYKVFSKITPKPDYCFVLISDYSTIIKRNHVVDKDKLENFNNKLKILSKTFPMNFIDSSESLDKIYKNIKNKIQ